MFSYNLSKSLRKRLRKVARKDKMLAIICWRKMQEVVAHDVDTIDTYKNLRSPQNHFKRIHLTNSYILLFRVYKESKHILFVDIRHWDKAYR